jgi:predicted transcriptional regulator
MDDLTLTSSKQALIEAIRLPEDAVKGLVPIQIAQMKETAVDVNASMGVAGRAIKASAEMLYELKKNLKHGNWTAFVKSGVLSISEKAASDLVSAYSNWLATADVKDELLVSMTPRTLAALGNTTPEMRNLVLSKLMGGAKPTEQEVRRIIKGIKPIKKGDEVSKTLEAAGSLVIENTRIKKASIENLTALSEENEKLKEENKLLKARIKELEGQLKLVS